MITICSIGSRGDVQPYVALGCALRSRGYRVKIATESRLKSLVDEFGLDFALIEGDSSGILSDPNPKTKEILQKGQLFSLIRITKEWEQKFDKQAILNSYASALADSSLIVTGALALTETYCVAESLGVPWIPMILGPTMPTSQCPVWPLASVICCTCLNKWSYHFLFNTLWKQQKAVINKWRKTSLGLPELKLTKGMGMAEVHTGDKAIPVIIAASRLMCKNQRIPTDYSKEVVHMRGFLFVPPAAEDSIDQGLRDFVASTSNAQSYTGTNHLTGQTYKILDGVESAGTVPIVYFGFGSMPVPDPSTLAQMALTVCLALRCKGIVSAGWSALCKENQVFQEHSDKLCFISAAPHDWLFPKMSCIVHHCGIGTMMAAIRAGVPSVPCPFMLDQPHNAKILVALKCAPCVVPYSHRMTAAHLTKAVRTVLTDDGSLLSHCRAAKAIVDQENDAAEESTCSLIASLL